jgi:outer membrane protein assembly factor BamB
MKSKTNIFLVLFVLASLIGVPTKPAQQTHAYIDAALTSSGAGLVSAIVTAKDSHSAAQAVESVGGQVTSDLWLINAVAASVPTNMVKRLASYNGVQSIVANKGVEGADSSGWSGYATSMRVLKSYYTLVSNQYNPVTYLPDGGFLSLGEKGDVLIINADGSQRAKRNLTGGPFYTAPVVLGSNGTIYFAGQTMRIYALNPDGSTRWQFAINGSSNKFVGGVALGADGTVYAADNARWVYALDGNTGQEKWRTKAGLVGANNATPAVGMDGSIYITTDKGYVYALNPNGTAKWTYNTATSLTLSPVLSPDGVSSQPAPLASIRSSINKAMYISPPSPACTA